MKREFIIGVLVFTLLVFNVFAEPSPPAENSPSATADNFGVLDISSVPTGARIWYTLNENTFIGETPLRIRTNPGRFEFRVKLEGYDEEYREVEVRAGETLNFVIAMNVSITPSPGVPSPAPVSHEYTCDYKELADGVRCRLNLPEYVQKEVTYLPITCKAKEGIEREACISTYRKMDSCTRLRGEERDSCAYEKLELGDIGTELELCNKKSSNNRLVCISELRGKAYEMVKFRLMKLEFQAIKMMELGVGEELTVKFISNMDQKLVDFDKASNYEQRKRVLIDAKGKWGEYKHNAVSELQALEIGIG